MAKQEDAGRRGKSADASSCETLGAGKSRLDGENREDRDSRMEDGNRANDNRNGDDETSSWWVYLLRCSDDSIYTGIATDVDRRAAEHNAGTGAKYTRSHRPVTVAYREACQDRSTALKREIALKRLTHDQKSRLIEKGTL